MFGLKMCHKSLLSGVPFRTLLTPVPPLFTATFLVEIIHGPRSQYFSTLVTRPPGVPGVGLHMASKRSCALEALAAQFTTGFPCLYLRHFERNIFSCGSGGTHPPPSQYIFQDALGPLQILLGNLYKALFDLRSRFFRSRWSWKLRRRRLRWRRPAESPGYPQDALHPLCLIFGAHSHIIRVVGVLRMT